MMAFQIVGPLIASVLYVIVFQKAGFRGGILAVCFAPVLGSVLTAFLVRAMIAGGGGGMMLLPLVSLPLGLLPLVLLAFMAWPPAPAAPLSTEK